jgi:transcriptional regulator with XRE-family HTH domain
LGEYLRQCRETTGFSIDVLAEKLGVNKNTLGGYERGERLPEIDYLTRFAGVTDANLDTLMRLRQAAVPHSKEVRAAMSRIAAARDAVWTFIAGKLGITADDMARYMDVAFTDRLDAEGLKARFDRDIVARVAEPRAGYAYIPLLDVRARAGSAGETVGHEPIVDVLAFKEEWIRRELRSSPGDLRLIYVEGDSMEPDLRPGDIVLVDHTDTTARREGIYVLRREDALLVKRLQLLPGGVIRAISRNEAYEPFSLSEEYVIIGRVVWACRRF